MPEPTVLPRWVPGSGYSLEAPAVGQFPRDLLYT